MHVQERDIIVVPPTVIAEIGYFLNTLLFPVKSVLSGLGQAFFALDRIRAYSNGTGGGGYYYGGGIY